MGEVIPVIAVCDDEGTSPSDGGMMLLMWISCIP
jgi:hypothetical protein